MNITVSVTFTSGKKFSKLGRPAQSQAVPLRIFSTSRSCLKLKWPPWSDPELSQARGAAQREDTDSPPVPITVRQLEAVIRISEALARMALQPQVRLLSNVPPLSATSVHIRRSSVQHHVICSSTLLSVYPDTQPAVTACVSH